MAGIEHSKVAMQEFHNVVLGLKEMVPNGLGIEDFTTGVKVAKDAYDLFVEVMAAKAAGEISDLDFVEIKELFGQLMDTVSEVLKSAA